MRLRAFRVENWRSIRRLNIADLGDGVTLLHGPNGTGKSSLVAAIRACLLDVDHDSGSAEIRAAVPSGTNESPEVAVEFETGGDVYRITKRFSPRKDGFALLERQTGFGWKTEVDESKQAGRRVREILGAKSSAANWFGLLWLNQGIIELSESVTADMDLRTAIINTLGGMVTPRDREIEKLLKARAGEYLTATGRDKARSRLKLLKDTKLPEAEQQVAELREERRRLDGSIAHADELRRKIDLLKQQIKQAEEEETQLKKRLAQLEPVKEKREALQSQVASAEEKQQSLQLKLQQWRDTCAKLDEAVGTTKTLQGELKTALAGHDAHQGAFESARQATLASGNDIATLRVRLRELEAQRVMQKLGTAREEIAEMVAERSALQEKLSNANTPAIKAPSAAELKQLAASWRSLQADEARLSAASAQLQIEPEETRSVQATVDGQSIELELTAGTLRNLDWHSQAELVVPGFGRIVLTGGAGKSDLSANEIVSARRQLAARVAQFEVALDDEEWLTQLSQRVFQQEAAEREASQIQANVKQLERQIAAREAELAKAEAALNKDDGEVETQYSPTELEEEFRKLQAEIRQLEQKLDVSRQQTSQAEDTWRNSERWVNNLRRDLAVAENNREHFAEERKELTASWQSGSTEFAESDLREFEAALQQQVAAAQQALEQRRQELQAVEQPGDADALELQAEECKNRVADLRKQHAQAREEFSEIRGRIAASEGKHAQLAEAEHTLEHIRGQLTREQTQVDAYRYLLQLFEDCRQGDIAEILDPVSQLVSRWAREIGMVDFRHAPLSKDFALEKIAISRAGAEHQLEVAQESYGAIEQLNLLVRLALGGVLAVKQPRLMLLDDPLVHADPVRHRQTMQVLTDATAGNPNGQPPTGPLQMMIMSCHPDRFAALPGLQTIDLLSCGEFAANADKSPATNKPCAEPTPLPSEST